MKKSKLFSKFVITVLVISMMIVSVASADNLPYTTYNFDYWEDVVYTPAAYVPSGSISAASLGLDNEIGSVYDLYVDEDLNVIALCDSTVNRVIIVNGKDYSLLNEITEFYNAETGSSDTFVNPQGVYISKHGELFVCDTGNQRIVYFSINEKGDIEYKGHLDRAGIHSDILAEDYAFKPMRICVDSAEKLYVICQNDFQGILQLEKDGSFNGYFGTISVNISLWDKIWKTLSTSAQRATSTLYIPTEYTGIDIDDNGFLLASYIDQAGMQAVMRLNSKGLDVVRKGSNSNVGGDIMGGAMPSLNRFCGYSRIRDVVYCGDGMYSMLDSLRGRIFTYDAEGNLLYIYGGTGNQYGTFLSAGAIETNGDDRLITDYNKNAVTIFKPTQYGSLINEAVGYRYDGDESLAVDTWNKVLRLNENFEQAYIGIGKAYLNSGEYKKAMDYLDLGMSRSYYSIAYKRYRNNIIKENFNIIFGSIVVLLVAFIAYRTISKRKKNVDSEW